MKISRLLAVAALLGAGYVVGVPGLDRVWYSLKLAASQPAAEYQFQSTRLTGFDKPAGGYNYQPVNVRAHQHTLRHKLVERHWFSYSTDTSGSARPTIVLLHGSARSGLSMIDMWRKLADQQRLVLIAPDAFQQSGWKFQTDGPAFLEAVIKAAAQEYPVDMENLFVFGHSAGAVFAQMLAERTAGPWKAVAAHAGYLPVDRLTGASGDLPILFLLGDEDASFPMDGAKRSAGVFAKAGHPTRLVALEGHTHWYYHKAPAINAKAWDFFEAQVAP